MCAPEKANDISFFEHAEAKTRNDDGERYPTFAPMFWQTGSGILFVPLPRSAHIGGRSGEALAEVRVLPSVMDVRHADLLISCVVKAHSFLLSQTR